MAGKEQFKGRKAKRTSLLGTLEIKLVDRQAKLVPKFLETYHLTYLTIHWSLLIIFFSFLARNNINWLWLVSLMILFQYITDLFDGAIGRHRNTGLIKWGYHMDHFLDFVFLSSIMIGYAIITPDNYRYLIYYILVIFIGFMVNYFLAASVTNEFRNEYLRIGPSEVRILFIIINILIIIFGTEYIGLTLPYIFTISLLSLIIVVYKTQKQIWRIDMKRKSNKT